MTGRVGIPRLQAEGGRQPCYFRRSPEDGLGTDVETVPGLYRACAIRQADGERAAALLVHRIGG